MTAVHGAKKNLKGIALNYDRQMLDGVDARDLKENAFDDTSTDTDLKQLASLCFQTPETTVLEVVGKAIARKAKSAKELGNQILYL